MKVSSLDKGIYVVRLLAAVRLWNYQDVNDASYELFDHGDVLLLVTSPLIENLWCLRAYVEDSQYDAIVDIDEDYSKIFEILDLTKKGGD